MSESQLSLFDDFGTPAQPGSVIERMLRDKCMSQTELAERMGRPANKINEIIKGKRAITLDTAQSLGLVLGTTAQFWMQLELDYQLSQKQFDFAAHLREESGALRDFPLKDMIKRGWLKEGLDVIQTTRNLLEFFGITSFENLKGPNVMGAAFRKSQIKSACNYALAAWLRQGEREAARIKTGAFNCSDLLSRITELRSLSLQQPKQFMPRLVEMCASSGVAVVFVPELPKCYASGAAYWIGSRAVIQLSLRFRKDDHFWFSFFHELGHIVLHGKTNTFLDGLSETTEDEQEKQANDFSARTLIREYDYTRIRQLNYRQRNVVRNAALEIGIAPGIVVGRLQHAKLLSYKEMNDLKVTLDWDELRAPKRTLPNGVL